MSSVGEVHLPLQFNLFTAARDTGKRITQKVGAVSEALMQIGATG